MMIRKPPDLPPTVARVYNPTEISTYFRRHREPTCAQCDAETTDFSKNKIGATTRKVEAPIPRYLTEPCYYGLLLRPKRWRQPIRLICIGGPHVRSN